MPNDEIRTPSGLALTWKQVAGVWAVVTLVILAAMAFIIATEREVSQYSTLVFEQYARAALASNHYARAARICSGALRTGIAQRNDYWGLAYLMRAQALAGEGQPALALSDLQASARLWGRKYYDYPSKDQRQEAMAFGAALGLRLAQSGDLMGARQAISAAAICSGDPIEYLYKQCAHIDSGLARPLWPEGPSISLVEFKDLEAPKHAPWTAHEAEDLRAPRFTCWTEEQSRTLLRTALDSSGSRNGGPCSTFEVTASARSGRSYYAFQVHVPLCPNPFGMRIRVRTSVACRFGVFLEFWFDREMKSVAIPYTDGKDTGDGWRQFDIWRDFNSDMKAEAERKGYDSTNGFIKSIGITLEPGPASQFWVDTVELYVMSL